MRFFCLVSKSSMVFFVLSAFIMIFAPGHKASAQPGVEFSCQLHDNLETCKIVKGEQNQEKILVENFDLNLWFPVKRSEAKTNVSTPSSKEKPTVMVVEYTKDGLDQFEEATQEAEEAAAGGGGGC